MDRRNERLEQARRQFREGKIDTQTYLKEISDIYGLGKARKAILNEGSEKISRSEREVACVSA